MTRIVFAVLVLLTYSPSALASGPSIALGGGMSSAGIVSGGFTLSPRAGYSWQIGPAWSVTLADEANVTGLDYDNPGLVNHALVTGGYYSETWNIDGGPSLTSMTTILCGPRYDRTGRSTPFCNRVVGVTWGARLQVSKYLEGSPLGAFASGMVVYVPQGAIYRGPLFSVTIGPTLRFGKPAR